MKKPALIVSIFLFWSLSAIAVCDTVFIYGKEYRIPQLRNDPPMILRPTTLFEPGLKATHPTLARIGEKWDLNQFTMPSRPVSIGTLDDPRKLSTPTAVSFLDLLIKPSNSENYIIPVEGAHLREFLQRAIDFEHRLVPPGTLNRHYAYLTLDQRVVKAGTVQRPGIHVDGFQEGREYDYTEIDHEYLVSDSLPTRYYVQPFDFSWLDALSQRSAKENYFLDMDRQVLREGPTVFRPRPFEIVLSNSYNVHEGDIAPFDMVRTVVRLSFEPKKFDRLGNTVNPHIDYAALGWNWRPRGKPEVILDHTSISKKLQ